MIRTNRCVVLLAVFSLFTSPGLAFAECAWVLWNDEARVDYGTNIESRFWHTIAATPTKPDCEARIREEIAQVTRPEYQPKDVRFKVLGNAVQVMYFRPDKVDERAARLQTFRYLCLPSGIDPRGPKTK